MTWRGWIDAEHPVLIPGQLAELADRLGLPSLGAAAGTVERLLAELGRRTRWLLIFDSAEHGDPIELAVRADLGEDSTFAEKLLPAPPGRPGVRS